MNFMENFQKRFDHIHIPTQELHTASNHKQVKSKSKVLGQNFKTIAENATFIQNQKKLNQ